MMQLLLLLLLSVLHVMRMVDRGDRLVARLNARRVLVKVLLLLVVMLVLMLILLLQVHMLLLLLLLLLIAEDEVVDVEEFAMQWRKLDVLIAHAERFDELEVELSEVSHVDGDEVEYLLQELLLLESGGRRVAAIVLDVHAQQVDEALIRVIHRFGVVERGARVVRIEEDEGGEDGELGVAQLQLLELTHKLDVLLHKVLLVLVELEVEREAAGALVACRWRWRWRC